MPRVRHVASVAVVLVVCGCSSHHDAGYFARVRAVCRQAAVEARRTGLIRALPDDPVAAAQLYEQSARALRRELATIRAVPGSAGEKRRIASLLAAHDRLATLWQRAPQVVARARRVTTAELGIFRNFGDVTLARLERLPLTTGDYRPLQQLALYMRAHHLTFVRQVPPRWLHWYEPRARLYLSRGSHSPYAALGALEFRMLKVLARIRALGHRSGVGACLL
jgi:hypothetical protein